MDKKGVDISVNVIIVAAIALAVLVVLFAIFTGRMGGFSRGVKEVTSCNEVCKARGFAGAEAFQVAGATGQTCSEEKILLGYYYEDGKTPCCCK